MFKPGDAVKIPRRNAPYYIILCEDIPEGRYCVVAETEDGVRKYFRENELEPYQQ